MSFFSDLFGGIGDVFTGNWGDAGDRFGNLWHDFSSDPWAVGGAAAAGTALTLGFGAPLFGGLAAGLEAGAEGGLLGAGAFEGAEAAGGAGLFGSAEAGGIGAGEMAATDYFSGAGLGNVLSTAGTDTATAFPWGTSEFAAGGQAFPGLGTDALSTAWPGAGGGTEAGGLLSSAGEGIGGEGGVSTAGGGIWDTISGAVSRNPLQALGAGVALGGLGLNLARGMGGTADPYGIGGEADRYRAGSRNLLGMGNQFVDYLRTNTLPAQWQSGVDNAVNAMQQRIIQGYAARGVPTDPRRNSALAQELNNLQGPQRQALMLQAEQALATQGNQLMQMGLQEGQLSSQMFQYLASLNRQDQQAIGNAFTNFAGALGGMGRGSNSIFRFG